MPPLGSFETPSKRKAAFKGIHYRILRPDEGVDKPLKRPLKNDIGTPNEALKKIPLTKSFSKRIGTLIFSFKKALKKG